LDLLIRIKMEKLQNLKCLKILRRWSNHILIDKSLTNYIYISNILVFIHFDSETISKSQNLYQKLKYIIIHLINLNSIILMRSI
jgi:hypothetical protein